MHIYPKFISKIAYNYPLDKLILAIPGDYDIIPT